MVKSKKKELQTLRKLFTNVKLPSGLSSIEKLRKASKLPVSKVRNFLQRDPTYSIHKPARKTYPRQTTLAREPDYQWQSDLAILKKFAPHNNGYGYLLCVIDVYTRFGFIRPLKRKSGIEVTNNFEHILVSSDRRPLKLQTDRDKSYMGGNFQKMLKKYDITHFQTNSELKATLVERFIRTVVTKIYKLISLRQSFKYIDKLENIAQAYNSSIHSSTGVPPNRVNNSAKREIWLRQHTKNPKPPSAPKFQQGDTVRISKYKRLFRKGYLPQYSEELFTIIHVKRGTPNSYSLSDLNGSRIDGIFYEEELTAFPITKHTEFLIDKIIKRKGDKVYVSWKGYPATFNAWVKLKNIKKLNHVK